MTSLRLALLILLVVAVAPRPARAQPAAVFVGGSVDGQVRDDLQAIAQTALDAAGWTVAMEPDAATRDAIAACLAGAEAAGCVAEQLAALDVDRGLVLSIERAGKKDVDTDVKGWVYRRSGELLAVDHRYCGGCGEEPLRDAVRELTSSLVRDAQAKTAPSTFVLSSTPSGARVLIDGDLVGMTPVEYRLFAGPHEIRIERDGYRPEIREVELEEGERVEIDFALVAEPVAAPVKRPLAPWLVTGAGLGLAITGGILLAIDEDGQQGDTLVPEHRDSTTAGAVLLASGAVVAAVGIVWILKSRRSRAVTPTVGIGEGSAHLGIAGRF